MAAAALTGREQNGKYFDKMFARRIQWRSTKTRSGSRFLGKNYNARLSRTLDRIETDHVVVRIDRDDDDDELDDVYVADKSFKRATFSVVLDRTVN